MAFGTRVFGKAFGDRFSGSARMDLSLRMIMPIACLCSQAKGSQIVEHVHDNRKGARDGHRTGRRAQLPGRCAPLMQCVCAYRSRTCGPGLQTSEEVSEQNLA
ncbi:unnamed protein product [Colias eurytheme]|nr:unnamed protein product [Colias eurytheme]